MTSSLSAAMQAELLKGQVRAAYLVKVEFPEITIALWGGVGNLVYNADTYIGAGDLGEVGPVGGDASLRADSVQLKLSGIDATLIGEAQDVTHQGAPVTVYIAFFDSNWAVIADPVTVFTGIVDTMQIAVEEGKMTILLNADSYMRLIFRTMTRRRTNADQQQIFSGDKFFEFVSDLRRPVPWGIPEPKAGGGSGSFKPGPQTRPY